MKTTPNLFEVLATGVDQEWQKTGLNLEAFPAIATRALENFKYDLSQPQLDSLLAEWFAAATRIPDQINLHNTFGQPPITVFNNGRFVVDIYIWLGCDTSIHSHGFRGAFKVLHGKSLHETFKVTVADQVATDVALIDLGAPALELLSAQDIRTIHPGKELTHRVIHLEEPTVTLCVKTINEAGLSQWHHFANGLAIKKRHLDPALIKQLYYFQYLVGQNGKLAESFLQGLLGRQDISTLMNLCEELSSGGYEITEEIAQYILEQIYVRYAETTWFARYEESARLHAGEIFFERCPSPVVRLATHFANTGAKLSDVAPFLERLAGKTLSKEEIEASVLSLIDSENPHATEQVESLRTFLGR